MEKMLMLRKLSRTYRSNSTRINALRGINLDVDSGDFVAVMGPSGCGKSTMLNLIAGLDTPTDGEIYLAEKRIDKLNETERAIIRRRHIGVVFQAFNLIGNLSVADNVELPALIAGFTAKQARERRKNLLEQLGIAGKAVDVPSKLSGGEQQRVAIARALVNTPQVLLADEPTGNLDTESSHEVMNLLGQYNAEGQTIVIVTHNHVVASCASRIIHMRDGLVANETRVDVKGDHKSVLSRLISLEV
ncbi:MAG TPA: ABC transporter ATP-binding protein [Dehalococcoidia bacterium]|nr:ABC transporter ATP-binding protein [Dehalococcoidia bacterium]